MRTIAFPIVLFHINTIEPHALITLAHIADLASLNKKGWYDLDYDQLSALTGLNNKQLSYTIAWLDRRGFICVERYGTSKLSMLLQPAELGTEWEVIWEKRLVNAKTKRELKRLNRSIETKPLPIAEMV